MTSYSSKENMQNMTADLFESVTGLPQKEVMKTGPGAAFWYWGIDVYANPELDAASDNLKKGEYEKAAEVIRSVERYLCAWGAGTFASAIYHFFGYNSWGYETNKDDSFKVSEFYISPEDHSRGIWYMFNFFKARKAYLKGNREKGLVFPEFLKDREEFNDSFSSFLEQKGKARKRSKNKSQTLSETASLAKDYYFYSFLYLSTYVNLIWQSRMYGSRVTCPFQRCRYYLQKIGEEEESALKGIIDEELYELHRSPVFKENSLPNWWVHLCLPFEMERLANVDKGDPLIFENLARNVHETVTTVNIDLNKDYRRIKSMEDGEWKDYVQKCFPSVSL